MKIKDSNAKDRSLSLSVRTNFFSLYSKGENLKSWNLKYSPTVVFSNNTRQNMSAERVNFFIIARWLKFDHKRKYCRQKMCLRRPAFRVSFTMEVYLFLYVKVRCVQNRVPSRSRLTWPLSTYRFTESSVHDFVTVVFSNICFTNN